MLGRPFGAYMTFPPLKGGYSSPMNLSQGMGVPQGSAAHYKAGGEVNEPDVSDKAKRLLRLARKIDRENPNASEDKKFSYLCQRSPGTRQFLRKLLQDGYSRSGARATIHGALLRWADGQ